jgi:hypothetical protein
VDATNPNQQFRIVLPGSLSSNSFETVLPTVFYEPQQRSTTIKSTESINTIEIFDLSGRQINSLKSINSKDITLDFNSQFNGLYILKIYVDKNVFSHKLMVF